MGFLNNQRGNFLIGILAGLISGLVVTVYYRDLDNKRALKAKLRNIGYNLLHIYAVANELAIYISMQGNQTEEVVNQLGNVHYQKIKELTAHAFDDLHDIDNTYDLDSEISEKIKETSRLMEGTRDYMAKRGKYTLGKINDLRIQLQKLGLAFIEYGTK